MSWNFIIQERKYKYGSSPVRATLEADPSRPPMQDIPRAGKPWKLPPPLIEGQTISYHFYDDSDQEGDAYVEALAIMIGGGLTWSEHMRERRPRKMVGTFNDDQEAKMLRIRSQFYALREFWLRSRVMTYLTFEIPRHLEPAAFAALCKKNGITFERRLGLHRPYYWEELWVNGRHDSTLHSFGSTKPPGTIEIIA